MSYYVNKSCCSTTDKNFIPNILFNVEAKQFEDNLSFYFNVGLHCKFNLPLNSILLNVSSKLFNANDIVLNLNVVDNHYSWMLGSLNIKFSDSNLLKSKLNNLKTYFVASFKINDEAFNRANIDMTQGNFESFINELYTFNNNLTSNELSFTNNFDVSTLNINNINKKYINSYENYDILPNDFFDFNYLNVLKPEILINKNYIGEYYFKNFFQIINKIDQKTISDLSINIKYKIDQTEKEINVNSNDFGIYFNYINNELEDLKDSSNCIFLPFKADIKFKINFKYKNLYYFYDFKIINKLDLFSNKNSLIKWELKNEK